MKNEEFINYILDESEKNLFRSVSKVIKIKYFNKYIYLVRFGTPYEFLGGKKLNYSLYLDKTCLGSATFSYVSDNTIFAETANNMFKDGCIEGRIKNLPEKFFNLNHININKDYQNRKFGSILLNYALKELNKINKHLNQNLPLVFLQATDYNGVCFYNKFHAENITFNSYSDSLFCFKKIKNVEPIDLHLELLSEKIYDSKFDLTKKI